MPGRAGPVAVYTDSTYVIQGIREWIWGWRKRGWRTATGSDVLNRDCGSSSQRWSTRAARAASPGTTSAATSASPGNERVDEIADGFARSGATCSSTAARCIGYAVAILDLPDDTGVPARTASSARRGEPRRQGGRIRT